MDTELLDIFSYKLLEDIPLMQESVEAIALNQNDAISKLFRNFHNYKASSSYLKLNDIYLLVAQGENILSALRSSVDSASELDIKWLRTSINQLKIWCDQLLVNEPLTPIDASLFPTISILDDNEKTTDIMQTLSVLYADIDELRAKKIQAPLSHIFKTVNTANDFFTIKQSVLSNLCDIVILNMQKDSISIAQELLELKPDIALITAVPLLKAHQKSRLLLKGLTHPIISPIQSSDLKRQLHNVITSHFSKVYSLISHQKIYSFIQGLDPLNSSTKEITRLCDDPESSIKELIKVVSSDAITTAGVLHSIALPIYGLQATSSVEQAVASFGKRTIKALTLSGLASKLGTLSLGAYSINEEQFKQTSSLRLALMNRWYTRVNPDDLQILSSSAILGNLGEILINQELINEGLDTKFKSYGTAEFTQAEVALLKTSSAFVTADILEFWGLEADLIDSIRYSDSPFNASTPRTQTLACANAIVYKMVTPHGELLKEIPESVKNLMKKARLEESVLEEALQAL